MAVDDTIAKASPEDIRDIAWLLSKKPDMTPPASWSPEYTKLFLAVQKSYKSTDYAWDPYPALDLDSTL